MGRTRLTSGHNRFVIYKGIKLTVAEACRKSGLNSNTVRSRLWAGWSVDAAFGLEEHPRTGGGWIRGRKRSEENRAKCRASQRRRRAREREQRHQEQEAAYEQFLNQVPSIRTEPLLMIRQFHNNKENEIA